MAGLIDDIDNRDFEKTEMFDFRKILDLGENLEKNIIIMYYYY